MQELEQHARPDRLLVARIEELARAQCGVEQIEAVMRVEFVLAAEEVAQLLEEKGGVAWLEACALAGQAALQQRMWLVAEQLVDQPVGARMAQWLAVNFLGHSKSDVIHELRQIVARLKGDPSSLAQLLGRALELVGGADA